MAPAVHGAPMAAAGRHIGTDMRWSQGLVKPARLCLRVAEGGAYSSSRPLAAICKEATRQARAVKSLAAYVARYEIMLVQGC